jgi:hypothetical protein
MSDVPPHLGQMMSQRGLSASPLFAVPETGVDENGLLPDSAVAPIRGWLADLAEDTVRRNQVVLQTLDGAIESLCENAPGLVAAMADQNEALETLRADAEKSFAEATRSVAAQTADGTLLRGEVLARWQDFVGTGEFFRAVEKRIGLLRDRVVQVAKGEPKKAQEVQLAVESGLEVLIREEGEFAARRVVSAWEAHPAGRQLLARDGALGRVSGDFSESAARVIRQWQGDVLELVASEGKSKKATARYLALGVNGVGVALMIFVFSQTGGLVGAELGVAGGTALLAQRVLEAVFGEDAVRRLAKEGKQQLDARVEVLMALELARFERLVDEVEVRPEQGAELTAAVAALEIERATEDRYVRESALTTTAQMTVVAAATHDGGLHYADDADDADDAELGEATEDAATEDVATTAGVRAISNVPQRLVEGDTGLFPALVSAQLSALAADAARRAEDGEEIVEDESDSGLADGDVQTADGEGADLLGTDPETEAEAEFDDEAGVTAAGDWDVEPVVDAEIPVESGVAAESVAAESADVGPADAEFDGAESDGAESDGAESDGAESDGAELEAGLPEAAGAMGAEPEASAPGVSEPADAEDEAGEPADAATEGAQTADDQADRVQPGGTAATEPEIAPEGAESVNAEAMQSAEKVPADPADRPIPVPVGLAALAAEAIRRPGESRPNEPVEAVATLEPNTDFQSESNADGPAESGAEVESELTDPALVEPTEPAPEEGAAEPVEATGSDPSEVWPGDPDEAWPAGGSELAGGFLSSAPLASVASQPDFAPVPPLALPTAPLPMSQPAPTEELQPTVNAATDGGDEPSVGLPAVAPQVAALPGAPGPDPQRLFEPAAPQLPALPTLPMAPMPMSASAVEFPADAASVSVALLVPPDQIPSAPPVPRWPEPEPHPVPDVTAEDPS